MLKSIQGKLLTTQCKCGVERTESTEGVVLKYLDEFSEYENYMTKPCPSCGLIEGYNMNIPLDAIDEPFMSGDLPESEEVQRYYVRVLIRLARQDFVSPTE